MHRLVSCASRHRCTGSGTTVLLPSRHANQRMKCSFSLASSSIQARRSITKLPVPWVCCSRASACTAHARTYGTTSHSAPPAHASTASANGCSSSASASVTSSPSLSPAPAAENSTDVATGEVPLGTPAEVEEAFACSVRARTVSNAQLRRYLEHVQPSHYSLAAAAVKGAKSAGLRINPQTYEALLQCLLSGGQLRASMELYQQMTQQHMTPTPNMYAALMELCMQRGMPKSCQTLFQDLQKRGVRPSIRNYELMIASLAAEVPPQWERAMEVFDKIVNERHSRVSAGTYNSLMKVYMSMEPFDWRVVYNCYTEMRQRRPRIRLEWESYLILREALRKGRAGHARRALAYLDAWVAVTPLYSWGFLRGAMVYLAVMMLLKFVLSYALVWYFGTGTTAAAAKDSVLPM